ncbi:HNH endonuclease [Comamonas endophytica]
MLKAPELSDELKEFCSDFSTDVNNFRPSYWDAEENGDLQKYKKFVKDHYKVNQNYTCVYCRQRIVVENNSAWDLEHIVPKNLRPEWMLLGNNLCIACKDCNNHKSDKNTLVNKRLKKYPSNKDAFLIFHPHFDDYDTHINVVSEGEFYFPRTNKGLKTYDYCGLSRFF